MMVRLSALFLCAGVGVAAAEPIQSYDQYRSWLVACDNTLSCVTKGFAEDAATRAELRIDRAAGPDGQLSATLAAEAPFTIGDVSVDDVPAGLERAAWKAETSDGTTTITTDRPEAVFALVAAARDGTTLTLGKDAEVPLGGFTAALLRIDDRQQRLGGVTALIRRGKTPADAVPPAPAVPIIPPHPAGSTLDAAEAKRLIDRARTTHRARIEAECQVDNLVQEPEAHALDASNALVLLPCLMGAYQGSSIAFVANRGDASSKELVAPTPFLGDTKDDAAVTLFTEAGFDPKTGTLSMAGKGRGLGDCGMTAAWIWNGSAFDLSELSLQQACGGVAPGDWPTLFRSKQ